MFHTEHTPVLLQEVLDALALSPGQVVVDATLGGGGYTQALLKAVSPNGTVIALDWDEEALQRFRELAEEKTALKEALTQKKLRLMHASYADLGEILTQDDLGSVDAIVADLGFSTDQLENPERGLSFQSDGPLDMRLNSREKVRASDILREWSEEQLALLFETYGDEKEARKIARMIVGTRQGAPLLRTKELAELIARVVSPKRKASRIHPATQVFQALRIAVNSERAHLERFLPEAVSALKEGGKLAIVTFHSGEDALVKHFFQRSARGCICGMVPCTCGRVATLRLITKKPLLASAGEIARNPRSRSGKLRVAEKIAPKK